MIDNFRKIDQKPESKKAYNQELFAIVAPQYDRITKILSLGRDRYWKKQLIKMLPKKDYHHCIDIACGTGDLTFALNQHFPHAHIQGIDLTPSMISYARGKCSCSKISFTCGDMCDLKITDRSIDLITGGYALRNAPDLSKALSEFYRILKPGGIAAFLDFSKPTSPVMQKLEYHLLKTWGGLWGLVFHRNPAVYSYIAESLAQFPTSNELLKLLEENQFKVIKTKRFFGGITELIICQKQ